MRLGHAVLIISIPFPGPPEEPEFAVNPGDIAIDLTPVVASRGGEAIVAGADRKRRGHLSRQCGIISAQISIVRLDRHAGAGGLLIEALPLVSIPRELTVDLDIVGEIVSDAVEHADPLLGRQ